MQKNQSALSPAENNRETACPAFQIYTDESLRELISHRTGSFPFRYYYEDLRQFCGGQAAAHWHAEFEFVSVERGTVFFQIGGQNFPVHSGEAIFINSRIIHGLEAPEEGIIPNILFTGDLIAAEGSSIYARYVDCFLHSDISHVKFSPTVPWQAEALKNLRAIYHLAAQDTASHELDIHICACTLWKLLYEHRDEMARRETKELSMRTQARLQLMMQFIEKHYAGRITLADIAASANISKSEAIRCFRSGMHTSPLNSVNNYRLARARELLLTTNDPVTAIAFGTGFENCSYFDRLFRRKYGISPRAMRLKK